MHWLTLCTLNIYLLTCLLLTCQSVKSSYTNENNSCVLDSGHVSEDYVLQDPSNLVPASNNTVPSGAPNSSLPNTNVKSGAVAGGVIETGEMADYLMILAAIAAAAAIWGTCLGCRVTCCRQPMTRVYHYAVVPCYSLIALPVRSRISTCFLQRRLYRSTSS